MTKLAEYLQAHEISDAEFAAKVHCDRSMISKIRAGKAKPSLDLALAIGRETGMSVEMLFPVDVAPSGELAEDTPESASQECTGGAAATGSASSSSTSPLSEVA